MASSFNYFKYIKIISDKIDYYGGWVSYYQNIDSEVNTITSLTTSNIIVTPVKVLVSNYNQYVVDGELVRKGDKQVFMKSTLGRPKINDNIDINGDLQKVIEVKDVAPGVADTLVYILQTRSYAASLQPVDVLGLTLGDLAIGTVVTDPYALDYSPEWMKVSDDYFTGLSTMISTRVRAFRSFDGSFEGGGYMASTPWRSSAMRKWLSAGDYYQTNYFSANFVAILQVVAIETQTDVWNDTLVIPSKEELFGTPQGSSSGSPIPYFSSDTLRIFRWYGDDTPMKYVTRDVYSGSAPNWTMSAVNTDGTASTIADSSRCGVVPMCFLQKGLSVVLQDTGKYSINY